VPAVIANAAAPRSAMPIVFMNDLHVIVRE